MQYDALNGGSSYGAGQAVVAGWNTVADGSNSISFYVGASFLSQTINQAFDVEYTMAFTRIEQAHHFGTQSLSNAIRVVAVERDCPKTNAAGDELRIAITIEDAGASVEAATFKLWLLDYSFSKTPAVVDTTPAYNAASLSGSNSVTVAGSGFHTLAVPSSYSSSQEKVTFSVDCEYLRAILRKTTGDRKNAHNLSGLSTYSSFNTSSAFPLGQRQHTKTSITAHATTRGPWFSPRLHIVDDIAFRPATTLTYTDTHVDLSAETMVIEDVSWSQTAQDVEKVNLTMQRRGGH